MELTKAIHELETERAKLDNAINVLRGLNGTAQAPPALERRAKQRRMGRKLSAEARENIVRAQRKRWAAWRKTKAA